jgi:hypothetical protein
MSGREGGSGLMAETACPAVRQKTPERNITALIILKKDLISIIHKIGVFI